MHIKLFSASGPGKKSELVHSTQLPALNTFPEVVIFVDRVFIQTPISNEYREVAAYTIRTPGI